LVFTIPKQEEMSVPVAAELVAVDGGAEEEEVPLAVVQASEKKEEDERTRTIREQSERIKVSKRCQDLASNRNSELHTAIAIKDWQKVNGFANDPSMRLAFTTITRSSVIQIVPLPPFDILQVAMRLCPGESRQEDKYRIIEGFYSTDGSYCILEELFTLLKRYGYHPCSGVICTMAQCGATKEDFMLATKFGARLSPKWRYESYGSKGNKLNVYHLAVIQCMIDSGVLKYEESTSGCIIV
jgi:hypothetical protein